MAMEKAHIYNADDPKGKTITVMFNPPELKISSSNNYADTKSPGDSKDKKQFVGGNNDTMTVTLFFEYSRLEGEERVKADQAGSGIRYVTDPIIALARIPKDKKIPPKLVFYWGNEFYFPCVILSIEQKYEYFDSSGNPLRAELTVKFQRHEPAMPAALGLMTTRITKKMTNVLAGMDHTSLSKTPTDWRKAEIFANGSSDPMSFQNESMVGTNIR